MIDIGNDRDASPVGLCFKPGSAPGKYAGGSRRAATGAQTVQRGLRCFCHVRLVNWPITTSLDRQPVANIESLWCFS
ncbi:hypothetical protein D3C85_1149910 [compost metagenome]